jgi:HlyD family secretion protein
MATTKAIQATVLGAALAAAVALGGCSGSDHAVRGSGTIELDEVDIASLVGGRVSRVFVEEGDTVRAGDTLAILAHGEIAAGVTAQEAELLRAHALARDQEQGPRAEEREGARADVRVAEASLKLAELELERVQALFQSKLVPQADLDRAQARRDEAASRRDAAAEKLKLVEAGYRGEMVVAARQQAEAVRAGLASARSKARELVLTAPISGIVLLKNVEQGEVIGAGVPLLTLGDPTKVWMRVYIAAPELVKIRIGDPVEVHALGTRRAFTGRVAEIATRAEFTPRAALTEEERANIVFAVKLALDPTDGILKPGLPADARILPRR